MSVMISAMNATLRDFTDAENTAIDAKSFSLSEGNWREHLEEYFNSPPVDDLLCIDTLSKEVDNFLFFYDGKVGLSDHIKWHIGVAEKLRALIEVGRTCGCDRIGIAG